MCVCVCVCMRRKKSKERDKQQHKATCFLPHTLSLLRPQSSTRIRSAAAAQTPAPLSALLSAFASAAAVVLTCMRGRSLAFSPHPSSFPPFLLRPFRRHCGSNPATLIIRRQQDAPFFFAKGSMALMRLYLATRPMAADDPRRWLNHGQTEADQATRPRHKDQQQRLAACGPATAICTTLDSKLCAWQSRAFTLYEPRLDGSSGHYTHHQQPCLTLRPAQALRASPTRECPSRSTSRGSPWPQR